LSCRRYTAASAPGMSAAVGSRSIARLYAATAPASSSFSSRRCARRNCVYASARRSGFDCARAAEGTDATTATSSTAAFIQSKLFHKNPEVSYSRCMPVDPELLEILACPNCKTPVTLVKNGAALKCGTCKRVYPIKDDIPVMLVDEATVED